MLVSIVVFSIFGLSAPSFWLTALSRIVLVPVIAGASYELIKFNAMHEHSLLGRVAMAPGIWLQYLTTRKPDDAQIEVAVAAMNAALTADGLAPATKTDAPA